VGGPFRTLDRQRPQADEADTVPKASMQEMTLPVREMQLSPPKAQAATSWEEGKQQSSDSASVSRACSAAAEDASPYLLPAVHDATFPTQIIPKDQ
jgi:hypothetical protein